MLLLRWEEMRRAHTVGMGPSSAWPAEQTKELAFKEFGRVANLPAVDLRCWYLDGGARPGDLHNRKGWRCKPAAELYSSRTVDPNGPNAHGKLPLFAWFWIQVFSPDQSAWCQTYRGHQNCSQVLNCGNCLHRPYTM